MRVFITASAFLSLALVSCTHTQKMDKMHQADGQGGRHKMMSPEMHQMMMNPEMHQMMMNPEMHEKMAKMHERMANCLRHSQNKKECMQEMKDHRKKMCSSMGEKCPMMGNMEDSPMNEKIKGKHKHHH
jgi:hypothetical protein